MSAAEYIPNSRSLDALRKASKACRGCELYRRGTQTVFGEGRTTAALFFIGEQPGDQEDVVGRPFVGPAGQLFDEVLEELGIDRRTVYVTNAVKHFKWVARGSRRLHAKPTSREVSACRPWLDVEMEVVAPEVIVCLGATAAQSLLGRDFRVTTARGKFVDTAFGLPAMATFHPAAILRAPTAEERRKMRRIFTRDVARAAERAQLSRGGPKR